MWQSTIHVGLRVLYENVLLWEQSCFHFLHLYRLCNKSILLMMSSNKSILLMMSNFVTVFFVCFFEPLLFFLFLLLFAIQWYHSLSYGFVFISIL